MKLTKNYRLEYEGKNTAGEVAKMNVQDYLLIIGQLPLPLRNRAKKINQEHLVDSLLRVHDYTYTNYRSAAQEVNHMLRANQSRLSQDTGLFTRIDNALREFHNTIRKGNDEMSYTDFKQRINGMISQGHVQAAIRKAIGRYGLSKIDNQFKDIHIHRDDKLDYYYYPSDLSGARPTEPKDFEVEDVITKCEYQ